MDSIASPHTPKNPPSGDCGITGEPIRYIVTPDRPQMDGPEQSSDINSLGGIYLGSANPSALQEISDAIHELKLCAAAFEQTAKHSWEQALAGTALDIALCRARAATATARAVAQ